MTGTHLAKDVMDNLAQYEKLDFRLQLIKRRVLSNTTLIEDMRNIKVLMHLVPSYVY